MHWCVFQQRSPTFLAPGNSFMEDDFSMDRAGGSGSNASNGEQWGVAAEALLARLLLTSCSAAQFLTGHGLLPVHSPGVGDACFTIFPSDFQ